MESADDVQIQNEPEPVFTPEQEKAIRAIVASVLRQVLAQMTQKPHLASRANKATTEIRELT